MKLNFSSVSIALSVLLCLSSCENTNTPINGGKSSEEDKNTTVEEDSNERPMMALEYVAEFNVAKTSKTYVTSQDNDQSGFYTWTEAKTACPEGTHLPSLKEWKGIAPDYPNLDLSMKGTKENVSEEVEVHGKTATYTADYLNTGKGISYALRFKGEGNTMLAAYRYEKVGEFVNDAMTSQIKVTARYLGPKFEGDLQSIASKEFWAKDDKKDVVRIFPISGMIANGKDVTIRGMYGFYWSSTEDEDVSSIGKRAKYISFTEGGTEYAHNGIDNKFSVRPFKD